MHCLRDAPSINHFLTQPEFTSLHPLIQSRLDDLADFADVPLSELVNIHILDPADTLEALNAALGRSLLDEPVELGVRHAAWFELTVIVGDDGFGHVIYIPTSNKDEQLLTLCLQTCTSE